MKRMICVNTEIGCSACGACVAVCSKQAVSMREDRCGFLYPYIDQKLCVECGICERVCALRDTEKKSEPIAAYAAVGHCNDLIRYSASGGVFASLATACINDGTLVSGAVMDTDGESIQVFHELTNCNGGITRMQGSKYVQSDAWKCYKELIRAVKKGKKVLFTGTPCQVSAVKRITGDPDNLITMDLVCHGVPSQKTLNDYVEILNRRFCGKTKQIVFRDKTHKKNYCARISVVRKKTHKQVLVRAQYLSYYQYFLNGTIHRASCFVCPYACLNRVSDLTIGDYWGIEKHHNELVESRNADKKTDWSCLLVNTEKGEAFLTKYGQGLELHISKISYVAESNQQLNAPIAMPLERNNIMRLYREKGYAAIEKEFIRDSGGMRYFWRLYRDIRRNKDSCKDI